jgi:hypothetical protein
MEYSRNVLVIQSLESQVMRGFHYNFWDSRLMAEVKFYCPKTNEHFRSIELISKVTAYSYEESMRRVVEKFMNKKFYRVQDKMHWADFKCKPSKMIHEVQIEFDGRVKDMFEDLFDINWNPDVLRLKGDETINLG